MISNIGEGATPLMYACQQSREREVLDILSRKRNAARERDRTLKTPLHYCTENTGIGCAEAVLRAAPELLDAKDEDGYTALHLAVIAGNKTFLRFLVSRGANVNALDNEKHSAVHWATVCGEEEALEIVLRAGADISTADIHGGYPLHYAAQMCGPGSEMGRDPKIGVKILNILLSHNIDINVKDKDGRQPILWAASAGSADAILALVKAGASVEASDKDGLTALHCAASRGHTDCIETLITLCGAHVDVIDSNGCTALFYAVTLGHADATQLLLSLGAEPNRQDRKGRTPAHCGAAKGQLETLRILLNYGANLWLRNVKGDFPLHEAIASGRRDLVHWLLNQRPDAINVGNNDGRCPIHIAAINNNIDMIKILFDAQSLVNPIMRTTKGILMTPLDAALHRGFRGCAKYLQLHGGVPFTKLTENSSNIKPFSSGRQPPSEGYNYGDGLGLSNWGAAPSSAAFVPLFTSSQVRMGGDAAIQQVQEVRAVQTRIQEDYEEMRSSEEGKMYRRRRRRKKSESQRRSYVSEEDSNEERQEAPRRKPKSSSLHRREQYADSSSEDEGYKRKGMRRRGSTSESEERVESYRVRHYDRRRHYSASEDSDTEIRKRKARKDGILKTYVDSDEERSAARKESAKEAIQTTAEVHESVEKVATEGEGGRFCQIPQVVVGGVEATEEDVEGRALPDEDGEPETVAPEKAIEKAADSSVESEKDGKGEEGDEKTGSVEEVIERSVAREELQEAPHPTEDEGQRNGEKGLEGNGLDQNGGAGKEEEKEVEEKQEGEEDEQNCEEEQQQQGQEEGEGEKQEEQEEAQQQIEEQEQEEESKQQEPEQQEESQQQEQHEEEPQQQEQHEEEPQQQEQHEEEPQQQEQHEEEPQQQEQHEEEPQQQEQHEEEPQQQEQHEEEPQQQEQHEEEPQQQQEESEQQQEESEQQEPKDEEHEQEKAQPEPQQQDEQEEDEPQVQEQDEEDELLEDNGKEEQQTEQQQQQEGVTSENQEEVVDEEEQQPEAVDDGDRDDQTEELDFLDEAMEGSQEDLLEEEAAIRVLDEEEEEEEEEEEQEVEEGEEEEEMEEENEEPYTGDAFQVLNGSHSASALRASFARKASKTFDEGDSRRRGSESGGKEYADGSVGDESGGSRNEDSALPDSGIEPSPRRRLREPSDRKGDGYVKITRVPRLCNRGKEPEEIHSVSVTQTVQNTIRKYHLERRIFYQLLELKRLQIRAGRANEQVLVKRLVDEYRRGGIVPGMKNYSGQYTFRQFEKFLYDQLRTLQSTAHVLIPKLRPSDDIETLSTILRKSRVELVDDVPDNPIFCTLGTHRCHHAAHAYTGIPCAAYITKFNHHEMPKNRTTGFLPQIEHAYTDRSSAQQSAFRPVTLELSHGKEKQVISLPTDRLDKNKRYYVTFTIKGGPTLDEGKSGAQDERMLRHRHAKSF